MESSAGSSGPAGSGHGAGAGGGGGAVVPVSGGSKVRKNAAGYRSAVGWNRGILAEGDVRKMKCEYCEEVIVGGAFWFKHHLAVAHKDFGAHEGVRGEVRKEMWEAVPLMQEGLKSREYEEEASSNDEHEEEGRKRQRHEAVKSRAKKREVGNQSTADAIAKKNLREEVCQAIASFFYNNGIPLHLVESDEFIRMCEMIAQYGIGYQPPTYHEISGKYLNEQVNLTKAAIEEHKAYWKKIGCTIMIDGWTDKRKRTILNVLVNSLKGTVFLKSINASDICKTADKVFKMMDGIVEEVGEENVVQIVTDNAEIYKAAGEMLMEKRKKLYWTPCAAHCIDLMLEDFEKKIPVHKETIAQGKKITTYIYSRTALISLLHHFTKGKDLVRPGSTHFATSYLTLGCLNDNKEALRRMFRCNEWKSSQFAKTRGGKFIENVVIDRRFWKNIVICLRGAYPLIKVLRLVDLDEKPSMGFIYGEILRAKEKIQSVFDGVKKSYMPLWEIIDERWDNELHWPLRATSYYLNPQLHYSPEFKANFQVKHGFYQCLSRMVGNVKEESKIDAQLENFKSRSKFFGSVFAMHGLKNKTPAQWWDSYGDEYPELQKFAIRVVSLACSCFSCENNQSAFEMVHAKRRNRLKQKKLNDVVFVMANSKLAKKKQARTTNEYNIDDLSSDDDWIVDNDENSDNLDLDLDTANEQDPVQVGEDACGVVGAPLDDLQIPDFDDDLDGDGDTMDNDGEEDHAEDYGFV